MLLRLLPTPWSSSTAPAPRMPGRYHPRIVAPEPLAKLTGRTARSLGGASGGVRAGRVITHADSDAALTSAPPLNARPMRRPRRLGDPFRSAIDHTAFRRLAGSSRHPERTRPAGPQFHHHAPAERGGEHRAGGGGDEQ